MESFSVIAENIISIGYDKNINLDTWFMPCFLARLLKDSGLQLTGNFINLPISELLNKLEQNQLASAYVEDPLNYLESSFPKISNWLIPWWEDYPSNMAYPEFYLNYCCGYQGKIDISLDIAANEEIKEEAQGRKIIALSCSG